MSFAAVVVRLPVGRSASRGRSGFAMSRRILQRFGGGSGAASFLVDDRARDAGWRSGAGSPAAQGAP